MDHELLYKYVQSNYPQEYRLVIEGGKLTDSWSNVAAHCFLQAMAAEVFGELLGLERRSINRLASVAACHDWKKRLEKRPSDFSEEARILADELYVAAGVDEELTIALDPYFLVIASSGKASYYSLFSS